MDIRRISILLTGLFLAGCGQEEVADAPESLAPVMATRQAVERREVPVFEEVVGTVRPRKAAQVKAMNS